MAEYVCEVGTTVSWDDCTPVVGRVVEVGERVTRCRDCKWHLVTVKDDVNFNLCGAGIRFLVRPDDFCSIGEPKEDA